MGNTDKVFVVPPFNECNQNNKRIAVQIRQDLISEESLPRHPYFKISSVHQQDINVVTDRFNLIISSGADSYWLITRKQIFHEYILHFLLIILLSVAHSCLVSVQIVAATGAARRQIR